MHACACGTLHMSTRRTTQNKYSFHALMLSCKCACIYKHLPNSLHAAPGMHAPLAPLQAMHGCVRLSASARDEFYKSVNELCVAALNDVCVRTSVCMCEWSHTYIHVN